jgi:hypothetical protein
MVRQGSDQSMSADDETEFDGSDPNYGAGRLDTNALEEICNAGVVFSSADVAAGVLALSFVLRNERCLTLRPNLLRCCGPKQVALIDLRPSVEKSDARNGCNFQGAPSQGGVLPPGAGDRRREAHRH